MSSYICRWEFLSVGGLRSCSSKEQIQTTLYCSSGSSKTVAKWLSPGVMWSSFALSAGLLSLPWQDKRLVCLREIGDDWWGTKWNRYPMALSSWVMCDAAYVNSLILWQQWSSTTSASMNDKRLDYQSFPTATLPHLMSALELMASF